MASGKETAEYILDQIAGAGDVSARKMFGEYGLYCDGKFIGLICDNELYIKPTAAGRSFIGNPTETPPFPGAKPWLLISGDIADDADRLCDLIKTSLPEIPFVKVKKRKKKVIL